MYFFVFPRERQVVSREAGAVKILVVDDQRALAVSLGRRLRRLGHTPLLALHPHDALAMLTRDIESVITDIDMPGMTGVELAEALRRERRDLPIAFCTGSDPEDVLVKRAARIGPVLYKPDVVSELPALLDRLGASSPKARDERHRVKLSVRFRTAKEFVREYTENLSRGGLFVCGAQDLEVGQEVEVEVCLPDAAPQRVRGTVTFSLSPESAAFFRRCAGAGIKVTSAPAAYAAALESYLERLERRKRSLVATSERALMVALAEAGYMPVFVPTPDALALLGASTRILAFVTSEQRRDAFAAAAPRVRVLSVEPDEDLDALMGEILDEFL